LCIVFSLPDVLRCEEYGEFVRVAPPDGSKTISQVDLEGAIRQAMELMEADKMEEEDNDTKS